MVKRLRHRPLTPVTGVRFPHGSPKEKRIVGDNDTEEPPVPIPNTEVKLRGAEDTWREAAWKNRSLQIFSSLKSVSFFVILIYIFTFTW